MNQCFRRAMLSEFVFDGIPVFLFPCSGQVIYDITESIPNDFKKGVVHPKVSI